MISEITSVQVLVFGNSSKEQTVEFCKENIVKKFNTVEPYSNLKTQSTKIGCVYTESSLIKKTETISPTVLNKIKGTGS